MVLIRFRFQGHDYLYTSSQLYYLRPLFECEILLDDVDYDLDEIWTYFTRKLEQFLPSRESNQRFTYSPYLIEPVRSKHNGTTNTTIYGAQK